MFINVPNFYRFLDLKASLRCYRLIVLYLIIILFYIKDMVALALEPERHPDEKPSPSQLGFEDCAALGMKNNPKRNQTLLSSNSRLNTFLSPTKDKLGVEWPNGQVSVFAAVWLRDNCTDPKIIDPSSFGRLLLMSDLDTEITIEKVGTKDTMKY